MLCRQIGRRPVRNIIYNLKICTTSKNDFFLISRLISTSVLQFQLPKVRKVVEKKDSVVNFDVKEIVKSYLHDVKNKNRKKLLEPYDYTCTIPRTAINPELIDSLNYWMELPAEKIEFVQEVTDVIYDALLLADDAMDESEMRLSYPAAHKIYGTHRAWLTSVSLMLLTVEKLAALDQPKALKAMHNNLLILYMALSEQLDHKNNSTCPTVEECIKILTAKTGAYYSLLVELMQSFSRCKKDFSNLSALFGLYLQIANDYINLSRNQQQFLNDKSFAEDISSGTYSLPVVLAIQSNTFEGSTVKNIMTQKTNNIDLKNHCVRAIENVGAIEYSINLESRVYQLLIEEIEKLGGNPKLIEVINKLDKWKIDKIFPNHPNHSEFHDKS